MNVMSVHDFVYVCDVIYNFHFTTGKMVSTLNQCRQEMCMHMAYH